MVPPMVQLTLGDFYKNHNIIINTCNVIIPDDAGWETIPEDAKENWSYGPNEAISWSSTLNNLSSINAFPSTLPAADSKGRFAQFPRTADIQIEMNVLEKDRPKTGRAIWGDASVKTTDYGEGVISDDYSDKSYSDPSQNTFSQNVRYDNDIENIIPEEGLPKTAEEILKELEPPPGPDPERDTYLPDQISTVNPSTFA
jgi:hypothetical protein